MIALSTLWNYTPQTDMIQWLEDVKSLGINKLELNYKISREHLDLLHKCLDDYQMEVVSVHSFCPLPDDGPSERHPSNYYRLTSVDEAERQKAVFWTKKSIDTACDFGAKAVVIHAGTLEMERDSDLLKLFELLESGHSKSEEFFAVRNHFLYKRTMVKRPYLDQLKISLSEVMPYAKEKGVIIGLETRYYPCEIPNFEETKFFLDLFHEQGLYYWHDVGHAQINELLGFYHHREILDAYHEQMIGAHIHGMEGRRDHKTPFTGSMPLEKYLPFFKEEKILKIIETSASSVPEMRTAVERLRHELS